MSEHRDADGRWCDCDGSCSTPVPASNVSEGLREAAIAAAWEAVQHSDIPFPHRSTIRAALAHAAPERLDVERLARALAFRFASNDEFDFDQAAQTVAAEYARLAHSKDEPVQPKGQE